MEWAAEDQTLLSRLHATISGAGDASRSSAADARPATAAPAASKSEIVGESTAMQHVSGMLQHYAQTNEPVLITGESGTGKEMAARAIHENSRRRAGPFVAVNCARIPSGLVASELFGYEKGAFTGPQRGPGARSSTRMAARCSSMKSATCRWTCKGTCCGSCRKARSSGLADAKRSTSTCVWCRPPTYGCTRRWATAVFAKIYTIVSMC